MMLAIVAVPYALTRAGRIDHDTFDIFFALDVVLAIALVRFVIKSAPPISDAPVDVDDSTLT